jgi:hypothetical protein
MTAKNLFFVFPVVTGLLYGCSKNEIIENPAERQAISFRVQNSVPATRTTGTTLDYVNAFVVYGTDNVFANQPTPELIFHGVTVARQPGTNNVFDYNPKRYYSVGATNAGFFAYSPVSKKVTNVTVSNLLTTGLKFDYTVLIPDGTGNTSQEDLLVAHKSVTPSAAAVALNFEHALSRIFVKAINQFSEPVTIKSLTLKNLKSIGTFTLTSGSTPWTWKWENHNTPIDYSYILASTGIAVQPNVTTATLVTSNEQGMMVLPQKTVNKDDSKNFDAGDFTLEVVYDVANLKNQKANMLLADEYPFVAGKQYAITITFTGTEINFTVDVSGFETPVVEVPVVQ